MALTAEVAEYLRLRREQGAMDLFGTPLEALRDEEAALSRRYGRGPEMWRTVNHDLPVEDGYIRVRLLIPVASPSACIVYFHGGGWVMGDIDHYDALGRTLAQETGCVVALVNYRKAPEHPFPTAVCDAVQGTRWVAETMSQLVGRDAQIIVAGDSAGGNLAAVVTQREGAAGRIPIGLQVLIYPVLDCDFKRPSYTDPRNDLQLSRAAMEWFWEQYCPDKRKRLSPLASPLRSECLGRLPATILVSAEHDVLRDEGEDYADRLKQARVQTMERTVAGQMHGFFSLHGVLSASGIAREWIAERILDHLQQGKTRVASQLYTIGDPE